MGCPPRSFSQFSFHRPLLLGGHTLSIVPPALSDTSSPLRRRGEVNLQGVLLAYLSFGLVLEVRLISKVSCC